MSANIIRGANRWLRKLLSHSLVPDLAARYPQYSIGRGSYGDLAVRTWGEDATLSIGAYTSIASGVKVFLGGEHRTDWVTTYPFSVLCESASHIQGHPRTKGDVIIGNDVWIGDDALILSGIKIGDGAVVGARAVITRDVPPYAIVVGNPGRCQRFRFDEPTIARLLEIRWWNWSENEIERALPDLLSGRISHFLENAERGQYKRETMSDAFCSETQDS
jgi:chloramphenicol O-acetyltransferase type B